MRWCPDVDLRNRRLLNCRGSLHHAFAHTRSIKESSPFLNSSRKPSGYRAPDLHELEVCLKCHSVPHLPSSPAPAVPAWPLCRGSTLLSDYWALTKPEVNFLILITTFVGFYLASVSDGRFSFARLFNTLFGTLLVASGTGTLNQYVERKFGRANAPNHPTPSRRRPYRQYAVWLSE